jgi:hypothetical protein
LGEAAVVVYVRVSNYSEALVDNLLGPYPSLEVARSPFNMGAPIVGNRRAEGGAAESIDLTKRRLGLDVGKMFV